MAIHVEKTVQQIEQDITIKDHEASTIHKVALGVGKIEAIQVTRWLTKASLLSSKNFVESLLEVEPK